MKKFLIAFIIFLLTLTLSITFILTVFEDRLVENFKNQIIDKTNINLSFSKIHVSLFKNFPYCSFILDDAYIFYTPNKLSDTLLYSKNLSFKINTINLFRSIYQFPEIVLTDGVININIENLKLLFPQDVNNNNANSYIIKTDKIRIKRCRVKYANGKNSNLVFHLRKVASSGTFMPRSLAFKFNFSVDSIMGCFNGIKFKNINPFEVSSSIKEKNNTLFSEKGLITLNPLNFGISFNYSFKNDSLQVTLSSKNISIKELKTTCFSQVNKFASKGDFSFVSHYSVNTNNLNSQKLTVSYELKEFAFNFDKNISDLKLKGSTTFIGSLANNISEITNFSVNYSSLEFVGSAKIKNLPQPYILIDTKIISNGDFKLYKDLLNSGFVTGNIKLLVKLNNIYNLNDSALKVIKLNAGINVQDFSIENFNDIKGLTGNLFVDENRLTFSGKGKIFNSSFSGELIIPDILNVLMENKNPSPLVSFEINRLNLDSIISVNNKHTTTKYPDNYHLKGRIDALIYKGAEINNLTLGLNYSNEKYSCDRFSMNAFSGSLTGGFSYSNMEGANTSILFQNIDIQNLFKSFHNFGQSAITSENISGNLSGKADFSFRFEKNGMVTPLSIKASSNLMVENGKFSDLSQFERLSKFLNLEEVESIHFKTLENNINIENGMVYIPSMNISSDAINFQLSGQHDFNGEFTYWLKVNLKEILAKKFILKNIYSNNYERNKENGLNLFFKFYGNSESYKLSLDKKSSFKKIKNDFKQEGVSLKCILKEEFNLSKGESSLSLDSIGFETSNKVDTIHNKNKKKPFRIEWDEIDSTKKR